MSASSRPGLGGEQPARGPVAEGPVAVAVAGDEDPVGGEAAAELGVVDAVPGGPDQRVPFDVTTVAEQTKSPGSEPPAIVKKTLPWTGAGKSALAPLLSTAARGAPAAGGPPARGRAAQVARRRRATSVGRRRRAHPARRSSRRARRSRRPAAGAASTPGRARPAAGALRRADAPQGRAPPQARPRAPASASSPAASAAVTARTSSRAPDRPRRCGPVLAAPPLAPRADAEAALGEALALDPERPVEPRPVVLERDDAGELDQLRLVEMLAQAVEQLVGHVDRAARDPGRVVEDELLQLG